MELKVFWRWQGGKYIVFDSMLLVEVMLTAL